MASRDVAAQVGPAVGPGSGAGSLPGARRRWFRRAPVVAVCDSGLVLFDHRPNDAGWARHGETFASYYSRSDRAEVRAVVALLESWFARYPAPLREALRSRFHDKDERDQYAAFCELYLHEALLRAGVGVDVIPSKTGVATPDFRVHDGGRRFYLEAVVAAPYAKDHSEQRRLDALLEELNRTRVGLWLLDFTIYTIGERTPSSSKFRADIERWLATLDHDAEVRAVEAAAGTGTYRWPRERFGDGDWEFTIGAIPGKKLQHDRNDTRAIRVHGDGKVSQVKNADAVREEVRQKARKYKDLDGPLAVAVLVRRDFANEEQVVDALFGSDDIQFTFDKASLQILTQKRVRGPNGLWNTPGRGSAHELMGVVTALNLAPSNVATCRPAAWANPFKHRCPMPIPSALPWSARWIDETRGLARRESTVQLDEFFGVHAGWPYVNDGG